MEYVLHLFEEKVIIYNTSHNKNFLRIGVLAMLILIMLQTQNTYINYTVVAN